MSRQMIIGILIGFGGTILLELAGILILVAISATRRRYWEDR